LRQQSIESTGGGGGGGGGDYDYDYDYDDVYTMYGTVCYILCFLVCCNPKSSSTCVVRTKTNVWARLCILFEVIATVWWG
jgi:hypothetical protein